jgi:hypothetical protein
MVGKDMIANFLDGRKFAVDEALFGTLYERR